MYILENGIDRAKIDDDKIMVNFLMRVKKVKDEYFVTIPAYNINFYAKSEDEIKSNAHESLISFFKYWMKINGIDKFHQHMLDLGFTIKTTQSTNDLPKLYPEEKDSKLEFVQDDELVIV